jgi:hypothetical protein
MDVRLDRFRRGIAGSSRSDSTIGIEGHWKVPRKKSGRQECRNPGETAQIVGR